MRERGSVFKEINVRRPVVFLFLLFAFGIALEYHLMLGVYHFLIFAAVLLTASVFARKVPFCPKPAFLQQLQLQWQNGQRHAMRAGGEAVAWQGKTDNMRLCLIPSLRAAVRFSTKFTFVNLEKRQRERSELEAKSLKCQQERIRLACLFLLVVLLGSLFFYLAENRVDPLEM
ncbi:MAG TPA: hypothetical protein VEA58_05800, partial [Anaerovoracaceae bacterium]|nr:hypothetical protein [Anaerovoracaceae bacterium]